VGAGPGHPDLLTVRAVECLGRAEVVVHDGLVPLALLEAVGCRAERMLVPRTADGSDPGEATGRLLADLAAKGRTIVRLKGGDPAVFGRLAEELEPLRNAGIPFEIVPGVTAALAAAAAAGVPLTSRQAASSLTILTGHEADEKDEGLDFSTLAGLPGTLAIYMGVEQVQRWSQELISAGKPADTPVTVISRCSWPDQQIAVTTLGDCGAAFERSGWPAPAIVIVGDVAEPRSPQPASSHPLAGRRVLMTRPRGQGEDLAAAIAAHGGECIHAPVIRIDPPDSWEPLDRAIDAADTFDWIVFAVPTACAPSWSDYGPCAATGGISARRGWRRSDRPPRLPSHRPDWSATSSRNVRSRKASSSRSGRPCGADGFCSCGPTAAAT